MNELIRLSASEIVTRLKSGDISTDETLDALQARAGFVRQWQVFLEEHSVLLCPVSAELPFPNNLDVESDDAFRRCFEAQIIQIGLPLMGLPGLSVAMGEAGGAPMGAQLTAGRYREDILLAAAAEIEARGAPVTVATP